MNELLQLTFLYSAIRLSTPLIFAALGGLYSERSGIINIALEGLMLGGAFTAAAVTVTTGSYVLGITAGVLAGVALAMVHAVATIRFQADQVVSGTAINILMLGLPHLLSGAFFLSSGSTPQIPQENLIPTLNTFFGTRALD
ncbi:MAG: ABC transporter permease, partial [Pyrinomonadaceae bacterium]